MMLLSNGFRYDNWILQTELKKLRSMRITSVCTDNLITRSLLTSLQHPKLRKLCLKGFAEHDSFQKLVGNDFEDLQSTSLTSLEICCRKEKFLDYNFFARGVNPWPNIKELKLTCPTGFMLRNVFQTLQRIESLELFLEVSKRKRVIPWDTILGNAPFDPNINEEFLLTCNLPDPSLPRPCIKNLKSEFFAVQINLSWLLT